MSGKNVLANAQGECVGQVDAPAHDGSVRDFLLKVAEQCAKFDAPAAYMCLVIPTERGELVVQVRVQIEQPLPRTH